MEKSICRTCLGQADGSIFKTVFLSEKEVSLVEMINQCTGLELFNTDELSLNICDGCTEQIINSYVFRTKCWDSHNFLLRQLENNSIIDSEDIKCEATIELEIVCDTTNTDIKECKLSNSVTNNTDSNTINPVTCELCDKIYSNGPEFMEHIRNAHNMVDCEDFECKQCKKTFRTKDNLRKHTVKVHGPAGSNGERIFMCQYCGDKFMNSEYLRYHVRRHTGEKPYKCDECPYRSIEFSGLQVHMRTHTGEKPYKCGVCDKLFRTSSAFANHRRGHSDETPFECRVCNKKFKKRGIYKEHMVIHDPDKYIVCKYCGKKFARKDNLNIHMKQHTGEKPHVCELCGRAFIRKHSWQTHMRNLHNK